MMVAATAKIWILRMLIPPPCTERQMLCPRKGADSGEACASGQAYCQLYICVI